MKISVKKLKLKNKTRNERKMNVSALQYGQLIKYLYLFSDLINVCVQASNIHAKSERRHRGVVVLNGVEILCAAKVTKLFSLFVFILSPSLTSLFSFAVCFILFFF